jgi:hypothetical protein
MIVTATSQTAELQQQRLIRAARKLLQPSPVRLHHVPQWLIRRIRERLGKPQRLHPGGPDYLHYAVSVMGERDRASWLDHWGSTATPAGRPAFVSEPYLRPDMVQQAEAFAKTLGLEFAISANSEWYPGNTIRLMFWESDDDQQAVPVARIAQDERAEGRATGNA